jgi:hypothetical protein
MPTGVYFSEADARRIGEVVRAHEAGRGLLTTAKRIIAGRDVTLIPFRNNSGETIPANAAMRITGVEASDGVQRLIVAKPNSTAQSLYLVNGPDTVASTAQGWGTWLWHGDWLLYDDANTPAYGETWGPQNASWEVKKDNPGFLILGGATGGTTDLVLAVQHATAQEAEPDGIPFRNDSGYTVPPHGVMFWYNSAFIGATEYALIERPGGTFDRYWLVNRDEAVVNGEFGRADLLFETPGPVAISTANPHGAGYSFGPKPDSFLLHFEYLGFTAAGPETATVNGQLCTSAIQHQIHKLFVRLYEDFSAGDAKEVELLHYQAGSWRVMPFDKLTARDFYMTAGDTREKGTKGEITWYSNLWVLATACENEEDDGVEPAESPGAASQSGTVQEEQIAGFGPTDFDLLTFTGDIA